MNELVAAKVDVIVTYGTPAAIAAKNATNTILGPAYGQSREEKTENERSVKCQSFGPGARRSFAAIFTRSARESAFIFRITLPRCVFTVISLMPSSLPTCLFNSPETTKAMTSRSRRLSDA